MQKREQKKKEPSATLRVLFHECMLEAAAAEVGLSERTGAASVGGSGFYDKVGDSLRSPRTRSSSSEGAAAVREQQPVQLHPGIQDGCWSQNMQLPSGDGHLSS